LHADLSNEQLYQIQKYACSVSSVKIIFASWVKMRRGLLLCEKVCMSCAWYDWFCNTLWKESLYSDGHQFHQYQQNEQSRLILTQLAKMILTELTEQAYFWIWPICTHFYKNTLHLLVSVWPLTKNWKSTTLLIKLSFYP
jgi:hypothetical protein